MSLDELLKRINSTPLTKENTFALVELVEKASFTKKELATMDDCIEIDVLYDTYYDYLSEE